MKKRYLISSLLLITMLTLTLVSCTNNTTQASDTGKAVPTTSNSTPETAKPSVHVIEVTIEKRLRIDDIIAMLVEKGLGVRENYIDAIQNYPFEYEFLSKLSELNLSSDRKYRLEGYFLPGSYEFSTEDTEIGVIDKILKRFNDTIPSDSYTLCEALGLNFDEVITIASIVEIETAMVDDYSLTSSVFINRLNSPDYPLLQSDKTVLYILAEKKETATNEDVQIDSPYNTYIYKGLPPSAICNPSIEAIIATLNPTDTKYYYFINRHDGYNEYASTYSEHKANYQKYLNGEL